MGFANAMLTVEKKGDISLDTLIRSGLFAVF
jgi:hypothetical protein